MTIPKFPQAHSYIPIRACSHIVHQKHTQRGAKSSKIIYRDQNQYLTIRKALLYIELVEAKILSGRKMRENDSRFSSRGVESWAAKDPSYSNPGWLSRPCRRNYNNWVWRMGPAPRLSPTLFQFGALYIWRPSEHALSSYIEWRVHPKDYKPCQIPLNYRNMIMTNDRFRPTLYLKVCVPILDTSNRTNPSDYWIKEPKNSLC